MAIGDRAQENSHPPSLIQSLKAYLATWVELFRTRLELFSTELQEERDRVQHLLIYAATAVLCLTFGLLLITLLVVAAFWDTPYRLAVLGGFALLYTAAGIVLGIVTHRKYRLKPKLFGATLAELTKDYQQLSPRP